MSVGQSLFMRAARREPVETTPVWFMRQAGRVLPEYRAARADLSLLDICRRPDLCAEVTLQPVKRFDVDAAILFADIMHPLIGVGVALEIIEGVGPVMQSPLRSRAQIAALRELKPQEDLPFVLETIRILKTELGGRIPLIGFAGAPFTLASYLIEGRPSRDFVHTKSMMRSEPGIWHELMRKLSDMVISYLRAQVQAGADALQLFDSWVGCLSPMEYETHVEPYSRRIFAALRATSVPLIHFGVNTATLLSRMTTDGAGIIGVDWRVPLDEAWAIIGYDRAIQGNLDPTVLLAAPGIIQREVGDILDRAAGRPGHIFNLGHGLLPQTPVDGVLRTIAAVRSHSRRSPEPLAGSGAR